MSIYHQPYTYLIGWSKHNIWYYGLRFSKNCNPSELFKTYFTSSKHVKNYIKENGQPDVIQIRKTFESARDAQLWEHKVLKRLKVVNDKKWLNRTDNVSINSDDARKGSLGKIRTLETRQKMSNSRIGKKWNQEIIEKMRESALKRTSPPAFKGKHHTEENKKKFSEIGKLNIGPKNPFYGKKHTEETKRKISEACVKTKKAK